MSKMFGDLLARTQSPRPARASGDPELPASTEVAAPPPAADASAPPQGMSAAIPAAQGIQQREDERKHERRNEPTLDRTKVRHSFDVYQDQVLALGDIQQAAARAHGKRPWLGDLVQEALDRYIQSKHRREGRTPDPSTDRKT